MSKCWCYLILSAVYSIMALIESSHLRKDEEKEKGQVPAPPVGPRQKEEEISVLPNME